MYYKDEHYINTLMFYPIYVFSGGKKTGTEVVFIGTKSGLTRFWNFGDQLLQRFVFMCNYIFIL